MSAIFFDDVLHIFVQDGNVHLVIGCVTGNLDPNGEDTREPVAKLIIPVTRCRELIPRLGSALDELASHPGAEVNVVNQGQGAGGIEAKNEVLGQPITFAFKKGEA